MEAAGAMAMVRCGSSSFQPKPPQADLSSLTSSKSLFADSQLKPARKVRCCPHPQAQRRDSAIGDAAQAISHLDRDSNGAAQIWLHNAGRNPFSGRSMLPYAWRRQFKGTGTGNFTTAARNQLFMDWLSEGDESSKSSTPEGNQEPAKSSPPEGNKVDEFIEALRQAEIERTDKLEEAKRVLEIQLQREDAMLYNWRTFLQKFWGALRGTERDPIPSHNIPFSDFWKLLEQNRVQYLDYKDLGRETSVVVPYLEKEESVSDGVPGDKEPSKSFIVYKRHTVDQMPIDAWNDVWKKLHQQLVHVEVQHPNVVTQQIYPTIETAMVWALRLFVAVKVYSWLDSKLYPIYRQKSAERRPVKRRPKLTTGEMELGSLGQSRARFISAEESTGVTFDDFAGQEYVKRELQEVVNILKDDKEFEDLGIYCPKGVMLYGPPGTGKTLLAKAIAGEAGVPFFSASGSEFVEMFVGVAAARVRDLFRRARQFAPSIIFIDEIDAIGAKRGGPDVGGGGVEREQGLVQILTELDGFQSQSTKVLVVGATNRLDMLDAALLRKGRFDKCISVGLPTEEGRLAILEVHSRNKMFRSEAEKATLLQEVAKTTFEFSGAELQNVLNEAAILAARKDKDIIERAELMEALKRQEGSFSTGQEDVIDTTGEAKLRIAYREAAIAVLECSLPNRHRPFTKTNIKYIDTIPNIEYSEPRHRVFARKSDIVNSIVRSCAPRIVEELIFGSDHVSWNSGTALGEAGLLADYLILKTGMTALGPIYHQTQQDVMIHMGPKVVALRDEYMRFAIGKCRSILNEYRSALETITALLLEKEEVTASEILDIYNKAPRLPQPAVRPVDEHGALVYAGRWGIYGVTLPGRVTFTPGNVGFATFGAPRPQQLQVIKDETWKMMDAIAQRNLADLASKYEDVEEVGDVVFSEQFL